MKLGVLVLLLVFIASSSSCVGEPTSLRVLRFSDMAGTNDFAPFDQTITDEVAVRHLSDLLDALPVGRTDVFCPVSFGLRYALTFKGSGRARSIRVEGDGCRLAYLTDSDVRATTDSFWAELAGALGLYTRGSDLFPLPNGMRR